MSKLDSTTHRQLGIDLFNLVWDYLEKAERTQQENDTMLNAAHASRYHWEQAGGTAVNQSRGEWQLSRVYAVLGRPEPALHHAGRNLEICDANAIGDFDLAFAYEAYARAEATAGHFTQSRSWLERARQAAKDIQEADDRAWLEENLETIPSNPQAAA